MVKYSTPANAKPNPSHVPNRAPLRRRSLE